MRRSKPFRKWVADAVEQVSGERPARLYEPSDDPAFRTFMANVLVNSSGVQSYDSFVAGVCKKLGLTMSYERLRAIRDGTLKWRDLTNL